MLGLKLLWRDWRGGELGVLVAAIITAVAIVTGISLFADRLQQGIVAKSSSFLAADRVLQGSRPVEQQWLQQAQQLGLQQAQVLSFSSMVYSSASLDATMQLASVKAVSDSYPLRGELEISEQAFAESSLTTSAPKAGEVWLDPRLLSLLQLQMGDRIYIGEAQLTVAKVVVNEPDRGSNFISIGPRVLMNIGDIARTGVIQPGSRVRYRYLFAGQEAALNDYGSWLKPLMGGAYKWLTLKDSQPRIARSLQRAEDFLLLAGSLGVGLAGIAIALAARRYSERHYDYVAMMKTLGASSTKIISIYVSNLLLLSLLAMLVGCALGWLIQQVFISLLQQYFAVSAIPAITFRPFLMGAVTALVCLLAFALPPLIVLQSISPLRVLRRDLPSSNASNAITYGSGFTGIALLMYWYSGNLTLTLAVLAGVALTVLLVAALAWGLLHGATQVGMQAGSSCRLALASMRRRGYQNALQSVIFSLAIMLLLLLVLIRGSLLAEWQLQLPAGTPNHFLLNIATHDVKPVEQLLADNQLGSEQFYAIVRGRLTSINGQPPIDQRNDQTSSGNGAGNGSFDRELNLTWSESLPVGNELIAGQWWQPDDQRPLVSVEASFAKRLGLQLGDSLQFSVGSEVLTATLGSVRSLDWDSMQPNFYLVFPRSVLQQFPATYLSSFYLPAEQKRFLNSLLLKFPTVSVIEMDSVIKQVRSIVDQVSIAIELVLGLIIVSGLLVLIASVQASLDSRLQESAILRTLGASRQLVLGSLVIEFASLGLLAGLLAAASAELSVYALQTWLLDMQYVAHGWVWWAGPLLGASLIGSAGYLTCRKVVNTPPIEVLRML
jgi:putative ABC transport system permease protein